MKKKFIAIVMALFMVSSVFGFGFSNVPDSGKEIVIMKGGTVVWHATNWRMEISTSKYTKVMGYGGDDYFKIYTFTGTPVADTNSLMAKWTEYSVVDCDDLTWFFR